MNVTEMKLLLSQIRATDGRRIPEDMPAAWHRILGEYSYLDCQQAVEEHYRESTEWLTPAHIRRRVKAVRGRRLAKVGVVEAGRHERLSPAQEARVVREITQAVADGALTEAGYREYLAGVTPWATVKQSLGHTRMELVNQPRQFARNTTQDAQKPA